MYSNLESLILFKILIENGCSEGVIRLESKSGLWWVCSHGCTSSTIQGVLVSIRTCKEEGRGGVGWGKTAPSCAIWGLLVRLRRTEGGSKVWGGGRGRENGEG